jgi:hypothetical protein
MGKAILMAFAMIVAIILFIIIVGFVICVVVSAIRYIYGEAIHTIRNAKRSVREVWWDVEWKCKRR